MTAFRASQYQNHSCSTFFQQNHLCKSISYIRITYARFTLFHIYQNHLCTFYTFSYISESLMHVLHFIIYIRITYASFYTFSSITITCATGFMIFFVSELLVNMLKDIFVSESLVQLLFSLYNILYITINCAIVLTVSHISKSLVLQGVCPLYQNHFCKTF